MGKKYKLVFKDENDIIETEISEEKAKEIISMKDGHLCWSDCNCAYVKKCSKIADYKKKNIADYDFIKCGYQIFREDGELVSFGVFECKNYEFKESTRKNVDIQRLNYLKSSIITSYFDAESVDEANIIQYELAERGQLLNGFIVSKQKYLQLKREKKAK